LRYRDPVRIVDEHERWRRRCLNLIPSENVMSYRARCLLASDMGHRYTLPRIREMDGRLVENAYRGTRFLDEVEEAAVELAKEIFDCEYACVRPISGHASAMISVASMCRIGDSLLAAEFQNGGYPGYGPDQMAGMLGLRAAGLPFTTDGCDVDYEAACERIRDFSPRAVVIGASKMLFRPDVSLLKSACVEARSTLLYDASHVLGLIAGGTFGRPLEEGVDLLFGSTHKSFFGPQGGIVLTNQRELFEKVESNLHWRTIDNAHWNRIAALCQSLLEFKSFGKRYAATVVANARALASELDRRGVPVQCRERGFTESHQVGLDGPLLAEAAGLDNLEEAAKRLERADIIIDCVARLGTCEVTRLGMGESEMRQVARLISRVLIEKEEPESVRPHVHMLREKFVSPKFCFESGSD